MAAKIIFIIGVSGVGKSTIGNMLSKELQIPFFDGDDFHPEKNIQKMSNGQALNDDDRLGWLKNLNELAVNHLKKGSCVIVCSALKESYRTILSKNIEDHTEWVFLQGHFNQIKERIDNREGHYMSSDLLKSQFDTLEIPDNAIKIDTNLTPDKIITYLKKEMTSHFNL